MSHNFGAVEPKIYFSVSFNVINFNFFENRLAKQKMVGQPFVAQLFKGWITLSTG